MRVAHSLLCLVSFLLDLTQDVLLFLLLGTRSNAALKAENVFLRKQLALYLERETRPRRANNATRLSLVLMSRLFAWREALVIVKPETFLGWHRRGFRLLWRWKSRPRGRPRLLIACGSPQVNRRTDTFRPGIRALGSEAKPYYATLSRVFRQTLRSPVVQY